MSLRISQKLSNFSNSDGNKSFLDFCIVYIHLILEPLKLKCDKLVNNNLYMKNFGSSVAKFKLGAEDRHCLFFYVVQGAHPFTNQTRKILVL